MPKGGMLAITTANRILDEDYCALYPGPAPGNYAMIEVSDSGTGIPQEVIGQIFEPFFTTKEQGKGTGLGLSMVFGFMQQSGGHINVYSETGVGTTFRLYLPRVAGLSADEGDGLLQRVSPERGGHETILAVEDNAGLRRIVARQLKELGYKFLEAEDGPSALKILEREAVDLLFTDIVMPGGMSGYDVARAALSRQPRLKVVLTSGFPETKLNGGGTPANMRLLIKPYRKADLAHVLREVLDE
jgi:CheY-like chemotaxis protein